MIHKHPLVSGGQGAHLGGVHAPSPSILRFKRTRGGLKQTRGVSAPLFFLSAVANLARWKWNPRELVRGALE